MVDKGPARSLSCLGHSVNISSLPHPHLDIDHEVLKCRDSVSALPKLPTIPDPELSIGGGSRLKGLRGHETVDKSLNLLGSQVPRQ